MARKTIDIEEERIVGYLVDEDDQEIGVIYLNDAGDEVELYYDEADAAEEIEVEVDPDDILYYFVDPSGNELGFAARGADGVKEEYWYPADAVERFFLLPDPRAAALAQRSAAAPAGKTSKPAASPAVSKDDLAEMFSAFKEVATAGTTALSGVMDQMDGVQSQLDEINPAVRAKRHQAALDTSTAAAKMLAADEAERAALAEHDAAARLAKERAARESEEQMAREAAERAAEAAAEAAAEREAEAAADGESASASLPSERPVEPSGSSDGGSPHPGEAPAEGIPSDAEIEAQTGEPAKPKLSPTSFVFRR